MNVSKAIIAALLISSVQIHAEGDRGKRLDKAKAMAAQNIDAKISLLNELKSCISGANDRSALKECRKSAKSKRQALKESHKALRKELKEKRQQVRAERKRTRE